MNFAIGQGDTIVTPLQLARAYAALANGGTLFEPRVGQGDRQPERHGAQAVRARRWPDTSSAPAGRIGYVDQALLGTPKVGTLAWKFTGFPLDQVHDPGQDRLRGGLRQAVDLVGRHLRQGLRRGDDGQPGRHRLGHLGPAPCAGSGSRSTACDGEDASTRAGGDPRHHAAHAACRPSPGTARSCRPPTRGRSAEPWCAIDEAALRRGSTGCCCWPSLALVTLGHPAGVVGHQSPGRPHRRRPHGVPAQAGGQRRHRPGADGRGARHRPPLGARSSAPLVYLGLAGRAGRWCWSMGTTINGSRSWLMLGGLSIQPSEFAKLAVVVGMALVVAERAEGRLARAGRHRRGGRHAGRSPAVPAALILAAARPRHHAGALGHRLRGARRLRRPAALAGRLLAGRRRRRRGRRRGRRIARRPTRSTGSWPSPIPTSTRAAPATTSSRPGSRSATAGCSARGCSTAPRPGRGSCPSSTPTSSSPSPGRSSGLVGAGSADPAARPGPVAGAA